MIDGQPFTKPVRTGNDIWVCGFLISSRSMQHCGAEAQHHGFIFELDSADVLYLVATAMSCVDHASDMRLSTHLDHELHAACGIPESRCKWDRGLSWCWLPNGVDAISAALAAERGGVSA